MISCGLASWVKRGGRAMQTPQEGRMRRHAIILALTVFGFLEAPLHARDRVQGDTSGRPVLKLRSSRAAVMSPARVLLTAELVGGSEREDFYCPEVEWDFA